MRCPDCGANMEGEGICPGCGHLVIEAAGEPEAAGPKGASDPAPKKAKADGPVFVSAEGTDGRLARSRDYTALLLGVAIYDCLLLPLLAARVLFIGARLPLSVPIIVAVCIPLAYLITRLMCTIEPETGRWIINNSLFLMCTIEPETGRWIINNSLLRRIFTKLNALWIDL